jgi:hypothetical protein
MRALTPSMSFISRHGATLACAVALCVLPGCGEDDDPAGGGGGDETNDLSFFVTSTSHDGDLGGLAGADAECDQLATAVGAGDRTWRAYLSAENNGTPIHAKDRIGDGPWVNANGDTLAEDLEALHMMDGNADLFIDENGEKINGQWNGVSPNEHDIITGSNTAGELLMGEMNSTCEDWTSNTLTVGPQVGHTDGLGPNMMMMRPNHTSWNGGHGAAGCSTELLAMRGSSGRFYCFAAD